MITIFYAPFNGKVYSLETSMVTWQVAYAQMVRELESGVVTDYSPTEVEVWKFIGERRSPLPTRYRGNEDDMWALYYLCIFASKSSLRKAVLASLGIPKSTLAEETWGKIKHAALDDFVAAALLAAESGEDIGQILN